MKKFIWSTIAILLLSVILVSIYYNVVKIGLVLAQKSKAIEWIYYIICIILAYFLLVEPIFTVIFAPSYCVAKLLTHKKVKMSVLKSYANNLIKSNVLSTDEVDSLKEVMKNGGKGKKKRLANKLYLYYTSTVSQKIDSYVDTMAKNTFYATSISQKGFMDMMIVLSNNFSMIKKIVRLCGFRPTFFRTVKLYVNVFSSSLIADGAQKMNVSTLFGGTLTGGVKLIADSVANGVVNAFFMLRTGYLTKEYIFHEPQERRFASLRTNTTVKAVTTLPKILTEVVTDPVKNLGKFIFKPSTKKQDTDDEDIEIDLNQKWTRKNLKKKD